jgi:hypothetical protein
VEWDTHTVVIVPSISVSEMTVPLSLTSVRVGMKTVPSGPSGKRSRSLELRPTVLYSVVQLLVCPGAPVSQITVPAMTGSAVFLQLRAKPVRYGAAGVLA